MQCNGHTTLAAYAQPVSVQRYKKTERTHHRQKIQERHSGVKFETLIMAGKETLQTTATDKEILCSNRGQVCHMELLNDTATAQVEHSILEWWRIVTRALYKTHY